jgi:uncharacterized membrane protein YfcA
MTARLALIGLVAGVFSTLFGVGGGIVVVPLLVGLAAFPTHAAAADLARARSSSPRRRASSLYAARGEVRPGTRRSSAFPRSAGALLGTISSNACPGAH